MKNEEGIFPFFVWKMEKREYVYYILQVYITCTRLKKHWKD